MTRNARVGWYRLRTTFGRRWGGYLGVVLIIGLVGGVAMGAVAGARSPPTCPVPTRPRSWS